MKFWIILTTILLLPYLVIKVGRKVSGILESIPRVDPW